MLIEVSSHTKLNTNDMGAVSLKECHRTDNLTYMFSILCCHGFFKYTKTTA